MTLVPPLEPPLAACDSHVHVIGPQDRHPMIEERPYTPGPATAGMLRTHLRSLGLSRVVLVQPTVYGTDNRCLLESLQSLGGGARGVVVVPNEIGDGELHEMAAAGVRGVRLTLELTGPQAAAPALEAFASLLAPRLARLGWHLQVYAAPEVIAGAIERLAALPVPVVLDHFAMMRASHHGTPTFDRIAELLREGDVWMKLSAAYRLSGVEGHEDMTALARDLVRLRPERMLWGTDWPHTNREPGKAPHEVSSYRRVDNHQAIEALGRWVPNPQMRKAILAGNPARLYGFTDAL